VSAVMNLRVPQNAVNSLISWGTVSFSGRTLLHGVSYPLTTFCKASHTSLHPSVRTINSISFLQLVASFSSRQT
jgi:hypothetical protein